MLSHAHCRSPCNAAFILPACTRFLLHHMFKKDLKGFCLMVQMLIFFFRSHPAPDMSFLLIYIQHLSGIPCQRWIDLLQSFRDILMYRTLTNAESPSRLPYRGIVFNNIISNIDCSLLDIIFQRKSPQNAFLHCMKYFYRLCHYTTEQTNKRL